MQESEEQNDIAPNLIQTSQLKHLLLTGLSLSTLCYVADILDSNILVILRYFDDPQPLCQFSPYFLFLVLFKTFVGPKRRAHPLLHSLSFFLLPSTQEWSWLGFYLLSVSLSFRYFHPPIHSSIHPSSNIQPIYSGSGVYPHRVEFNSTQYILVI